MPEPSTLILFTGAAVLLAIVPGPAVLLPQFVNPDGANAQLQMLALGAVFVAVAFTTDSLWALVSGIAAEWLRSRRRFANIDRYGAGTIFVGLGVSSALAHPARH